MRRGGAAARRYARTFSGFSPDARLFLAATFAYGAVSSLYWIDFNLYLEALGLGPSIGLVAAVAQIAGAGAALPASAMSDRYGRRTGLLGGMVLITIALVGLLPGNVPLVFVCAGIYGAGSQIVAVNSTPFMAEHTRAEHRSEYFAAQYAASSITQFVAAIVGARVAGWLSGSLGLAGSVGPYQVILGAMVVLALVTIVITSRLTPDRPVRAAGAAAGSAIRALRSLPLRFDPADRRLLFRLLVPGFLISLGAGQVLPFLNVFIKTKFSLDLASLNDIFAVTSLGTAIAILIQPALARRYGKIGSVVLVQAASIPFILALGFSPALWTVIIAMAVRNSLMNAGNPIYNAFAMERLPLAERATYSAAASLLWSVGWAIGAPYYFVLQQSLGFDLGYTVNFLTIIALYTVATALYWLWFGRAERSERLTVVPLAEPPGP